MNIWLRIIIHTEKAVAACREAGVRAGAGTRLHGPYILASADIGGVDFQA